MEPMQKRDPLRWKSPESQRLRWVRLAEGFTDSGGSARFAAKVKIGRTAYSQYENGVRLSLDAIIKVTNRVPGLTTDYLILGNEEGMSLDLRRRIEAARMTEEAEGLRQ